MKILVIGGTHFMGPHVVRQLTAVGHEVTVFHRGQSEAELPPEVRHLHGDRQRLAEFAGEFRRLAPEVVLHMIAMTEADGRTLMETFTGLARRVVVLSSVDVYRAYDVLRGKEPGPPEPVPLAEDSPLREKLYPYRGDTPRPPDDPSRWVDDYDKILVERAVLGESRLPGAVLRLPMVYGPGDYQHRLFSYLKRMDDGRPAILLQEGTAQFRACRGYVENVAAAIACAVVEERAAGRIYNVAETEAFSEAEWVRRIGRAAGWSGDVVILPKEGIPSHLKSDANSDQHWDVDSTRIRRELGYAEPIPLEQALRQTVEWERAHPPGKIDPAAFDYAAEDAALAAHALTRDPLRG